MTPPLPPFIASLILADGAVVRQAKAYRMHQSHTALSARVSSAQQATAHTIASRVVALRERAALDGLVLPEAMQFLDEDDSGYAFYGQPISCKATKEHARPYPYDRCLGTDAYRFGGERICTNAQVRTDWWHWSDR